MKSLIRNNKVRYLTIFFISLLAGACAVQEKKETPPTLKYELKKFKLQSSKCNTDSISCATYEVSYPVFTQLDSSVQGIISKGIDASVSMGNPQAQGWTMEQIAKDFIANYEKLDGSGISEGSWYYHANVKVETFVDTLLSISVNEEYYTGGAHGGVGKFFINLNPQTGKAVTLNSILRKGYEKVLLSEGEHAFRLAHELPEEVSLAEQGYEFPNDQFQLNSNYGFTKDGIIFFYNNYEIAAYAAGPSQILIPYERIRDWLH